jgi:APA family basic amino acid/polyamine antiporter
MAEALSSRPAPAGAVRLARVLGARDASAIMISNMIGVGILTLPGIVALSLGSPGLALGAWTLGGAVSLCGALVHAELGCRYPLAGGDYVYLRKAFGAPAAFLSGWTSFVVGFPGAIAASVMAAAAALLDAGGWSEARGLELALALGLLLALSLLHAAGLRPGKGVQNVLTAAKLVILLGLVTGGWMLVGPSPPEPAAASPGGPPPAVAALIILFAYSGWNAAGYMAGEIRTPRTDLPRALIGGVLVVTALYVAVNLTYFRVVPAAEMGRSINVGGEVARRAFGDAGGRVLSFALAIVFLGGASAMILTGPRIYFAMARDGLFPHALASVGQKSRAPVRALWLQSFWSALLLAAGTTLTPASQGAAATFERIVSWTSFAILPFAALTASSIFVFRRRDRARGWTPSFPAPGYPWTAAVFVGAAALVASAFLGVGGENRENAIVGLALVLSGLPVYLLWSLRGRETPCRRAVLLILAILVPAGARGAGLEPVAFDSPAGEAGPLRVRNVRLIRDGLAPTAYFIDVWSSIGPYDYWTHDGRFRDTLGGAPQISESGHDQLIGWLDGAQANHLRVGEPPQGCSAWAVWPIKTRDAERVPWLDAAHHDRFILHGAGYEDRYRGGLDAQEHGIYSDDYVATEMLTGHPAMVPAPFGRGVVRKYWLLQDAARALARRRIETVEFAGGDIHRQRVLWEGGGEVWVNRGQSPWHVAGHELGPYGFFCRVPAGDGVVEAAVERQGGRTVEWSLSPLRLYVNDRPDSGGGAVTVAGITTDGACRIHREAQALVVTPLPGGAAFTVRIEPEKLPWRVELTGEVEAVAEDGAASGRRNLGRDGEAHVLGCEPGVFAYRLATR